MLCNSRFHANLDANCQPGILHLEAVNASLQLTVISMQAAFQIAEVAARCQWQCASSDLQSGRGKSHDVSSGSPLRATQFPETRQNGRAGGESNRTAEHCMFRTSTTIRWA